ncbi:MAG TPA: 6-hydroxymethylpterin diphosphokinase MptE-like protein [Spirochaetia bacterium]|nr:6-hydroxymethylpterin diphosphokinase MptE-like protein [Spirochaetia bacterium]
MVEVFTSRSGSPSIRVEGVALHSAYDPSREAERFARNSLGSELPSTIVVLGEGLGYLTRWLVHTYPGVRVLTIFYSTDVFQKSAELSQLPPPHALWHPGMGQGIADFLRTHIGELDVEGLRTLEWPPSARLFSRHSRSANEALQQCLMEANGSLVTTMSMGRLWLRNCLANFLMLGDLFEGAPCAPDRLVVIAASGPSLETAAPLLREIRDAVDIWALPSSAPFLMDAGLSPDLFILTDPGFYGIAHLHHAAPPCPVAMPLSAARGLWRLLRPGTPNPVRPFLLAQPGMLEEAFLKALGVSAPVVAPHGTVAATALDLAYASTKGPVICAGLDMCTYDIFSHARPNEFERFFLMRSTRTAPSYSSMFRRSVDQKAIRIPGDREERAPLSLRTYAGWLANENKESDGRLYRLLPSVVALPTMIPLDGDSMRNLARRSAPSRPGPNLVRRPPLPSRAERVSRGSRILEDWRKTLRAAKREAHGGEALDSLTTKPILSLTYQLAARQLLETRRAARLGDRRKAVESAIALLDDCEQFLYRLQERALNAN